MKKKLRIHNFSIHTNCQNRFINECARKKLKNKITDLRNLLWIKLEEL